MKGQLTKTIPRGEVVSENGEPVVEIPIRQYLSREPYELTNHIFFFSSLAINGVHKIDEQ